MTFEKKLFASIAFLSITSFFFFSAGTVFAKGRSNPAVRQDLSSLLHARTYEPVVSQIQENDFSLADSSIPVAGGRMAAVNEHDLGLSVPSITQILCMAKHLGMAEKPMLARQQVVCLMICIPLQQHTELFLLVQSCV